MNGQKACTVPRGKNGREDADLAENLAPPGGQERELLWKPLGKISGLNLAIEYLLYCIKKVPHLQEKTVEIIYKKYRFPHGMWKT